MNLRLLKSLFIPLLNGATLVKYLGYAHEKCDKSLPIQTDCSAIDSLMFEMWRRRKKNLLAIKQLINWTNRSLSSTDTTTCSTPAGHQPGHHHVLTPVSQPTWSHKCSMGLRSGLLPGHQVLEMVSDKPGQQWSLVPDCWDDLQWWPVLKDSTIVSINGWNSIRRTFSTSSPHVDPTIQLPAGRIWTRHGTQASANVFSPLIGGGTTCGHQSRWIQQNKRLNWAGYVALLLTLQMHGAI